AMANTYFIKGDNEKANTLLEKLQGLKIKPTVTPLGNAGKSSVIEIQALASLALLRAGKIKPARILLEKIMKARSQDGPWLTPELSAICSYLFTRAEGELEKKGKSSVRVVLNNQMKVTVSLSRESPRIYRVTGPAPAAKLEKISWMFL
ncbi:MAG: hypothetical protein J7M18_08470, partial [Candidatus Eremiobacteraeota bacterium]|nr:hypothetical protein [Candidatus Eremiobacteraeota bacterium]